MPIGTSTILPEPDVTIGFPALQKMRQLIHLDDLSILGSQLKKLAQCAGISSGRENVIEYTLQKLPGLFTRKISAIRVRS